MRRILWVFPVLFVLLMSGATAFGFEMAPLPGSFLSWQGEDGKYGYRPSPLNLSHLEAANYSGYFERVGRRAGGYPAKYDPRALGLTALVRDQGNNGTCWAFSSVSSLGSSHILRIGEDITLSAMHLAWFAYNGPYSFAPKNPLDFLNVGGWVNIGVSTFARWIGPVKAESLYYMETPDRMARSYENALHLQNAYYLTLKGMHQELKPGEDVQTGDYSKMADELRKDLILNHGAITVAFTSQFINEKYDNITHGWYNDEEFDADHAVIIVGWDDNFSRENFTVEPERDGAWLVQNSWGTTWGDGGFFWLSYEDRTLLEGTVLIAEEPDNYERNYGYDDLGWCRAVQYGSEPRTGRMANVFRANSSGEQLEAVSFYTTTSDARYEIRIYTGLADAANPASGTLAHVQSGVHSLAGYHTVKLDAAVALSQNSPFSVVLTVENPDYEYPLAVEAFVPRYSENARSARGQSFFSKDGLAWRDGADVAEEEGVGSLNACIRAFTSAAQNASPLTTAAAFSEDPKKWRVISTQNDQDSSVRVRIETPVLSDLVPEEIEIDLRGIDLERQWIESIGGVSTLVIEGTSANKAALENASLWSITCKLGGLEVVQDFWNDRKIEVAKMPHETGSTGSSGGSGCDTGAALFSLCILLILLAVQRRRGIIAG